jgi:hypothetical protein
MDGGVARLYPYVAPLSSPIWYSPKTGGRRSYQLHTPSHFYEHFYLLAPDSRETGHRRVSLVHKDAKGRAALSWTGSLHSAIEG